MILSSAKRHRFYHLMYPSNRHSLALDSVIFANRSLRCYMSNSWRGYVNGGAA